VKKKHPRWLISTDSGMARTCDALPERTARCRADVSGEMVNIYRLVPLKRVAPSLVIPKGASKEEVKRLRKVAALKCGLRTASAEFYALPKKDSFSGLGLANEIDRLQKALDALGDKSPREHPEVSIEIPC